MLKRHLIDIRDFCYYLELKEDSGHKVDSGITIEASKVKFYGFLYVFYLSLALIFYKILLLTHLVDRLEKQSSVFGKFTFGLLFLILPIFLLGRYLLKSIKDVPYPPNFSEIDYKRKRSVSLKILLYGFGLFIFIYFALQIV